MSADDREFIERLLAAGRRDTTPDEAARQTKISNRVLDVAPAPDPSPASSIFPSWSVAAALGALLLGGSVYFAMSRSAPKPSVAPAVTEASPLQSAAPSHEPLETHETPSADPSVWELPSVAPSKKAPPAPSAESDDLGRELAALERARRRLREHEPAAAMKELDDFDRRFPRPRVGDEVAVLRVEVLVALGRTDEAARLGRAFIARHPDSIYRARVAQMIGEASL